MFSIFKRTALVAVFGLATVLPAAAAGRTFSLTSDSEIRYTGVHATHTWEGVSHALKGEIRLDDASLSALPITLSVPVRSFDSGNRNRDSNALVTMEAGRFPQTSVRIDSIEVLKKDAGPNPAHGQARLKGVLTFHGVTRPLSFVLDGQVQGNRLIATGQFSFLLSEFQVKRPSLLFVAMDDKIDVAVHLVGVAK